MSAELPHHIDVRGICNSHSLCACPAIPVLMHRRRAQPLRMQVTAMVCVCHPDTTKWQ